VNDDGAEMITRAERRGEGSLRDEPRARRARYDRGTGPIHVDLTNGCSFAFPARNAQGLERASDAELAQVEILGLGPGLHWERLDVDLSVPGLLAGLFGTRAWMDRQRAARAGAATSAAKAAAARRNGAKGGRRARLRPRGRREPAPDDRARVGWSGKLARGGCPREHVRSRVRLLQQGERH
jgi:Protein of unknown function (DUF2442)